MVLLAVPLPSSTSALWLRDAVRDLWDCRHARPLADRLDRRRASAREALPEPLKPLLLVPIWFIVFPFTVLKIRSRGLGPAGDSLDAAPPDGFRDLRDHVLDLHGKRESGKRVSPYGLAVAATFWLADYLIVALRVMRPARPPLASGEVWRAARRGSSARPTR